MALRAGESSRLNIVAASGRILLAGGVNFGAAGFGNSPGGDEFDRPEYNRATRPQPSPCPKILEQTGPLATTSANLSGQPPLESVAEIQAQFPEVLTLVPSELATGTTASSLPSTVAKWTGSEWKILRHGAIELEC